MTQEWVSKTKILAIIVVRRGISLKILLFVLVFSSLSYIFETLVKAMSNNNVNNTAEEVASKYQD